MQYAFSLWTSAYDKGGPRMTLLQIRPGVVATLVTVVVLLAQPWPFAGAQLPVGVEVERLLIRAERQVAAGDYGAAIATFDRVLEVYRENRNQVPAEFWVNDARLAQGAGLHRRAEDSITRYLQMTGQDGEYYWQALELLDTAQERWRTQLEADVNRLVEETEARRRAEEAEARRLREEADLRRRAEEAETLRNAQEADWRRVRGSFNAADLEEHIREFAASPYREAARTRVTVLRAPRSDENGWTRLHYAAALDLADVVRHLVRRGAHVDAELKRDGRALSGGVTGSLGEMGRNFRSWTRDGETPLHVAAVVGARDSTAALIELGANVGRGTKFDWQPLHYAAWADAVDVIQVLLANGADINDRTDEVDERGKTPLAIALEFGRRAAADMLRARGARR